MVKSLNQISAAGTADIQFDVHRALTVTRTWIGANAAELGCALMLTLMAIGLTFVFYVIHMRLWVVPVQNANGSLSLWIGGSANRNRDAFEEKFKVLVEDLRKELNPVSVPAELQEASIAGR